MTDVKREYEGKTLAEARQQASGQDFEVVKVLGGFLGAETKTVSIRADAVSAGASVVPRGESKDGSAQEDAPRPSLTASEVVVVVAGVITAMGLEVSCVGEDTPDGVLVTIDGADIDFLVGDEGPTLDALQLVTGLLVRKRVGWSQPVSLECDGIRSDRDEELRQLAEDGAERALRAGSARLPPLNSYERRIVHLTLSERTDVATASEGDGTLKRVVVRRVGEGNRGKGRRR